MTPFGSKRRKLDMSGVSVFIGMPTHRPIPPETVASLLATQEACWTRNIPLHLVIEKGSSIVEAARTKVAHSFLETGCSHLFWIDSDMQWKAEDFIRVLGLATKNPIVGAAYRMKCADVKFMVGLPDGKDTVTANEYGCLSWSGMGLGFTCVGRDVIERLAEAAPVLKFPDIPKPVPHLFRQGTDGNGNFSGEDIQFFSDCRKHGFDVWIDPTVWLGHIGDAVYGGRLVDQLEKVAAAPSEQLADAGAA